MVRLWLKALDWAQSREGQHQSLGSSGKTLWDWGSLMWTLKERMYLHQGRHNCGRGREGEWIWYGHGLAEINQAGAEESKQMDHMVKALYKMVGDVLKFRSNHVTSLLFPSPPESALHSSTAYKVFPILSSPNSVVTTPFSCQNNYTLALSHKL